MDRGTQPSLGKGVLARPKETYIAILCLLAIPAYLILHYGTRASSFTSNLPLYLALVAGGVPLVIDLAGKLIHLEFGSDLLAGISIVTAVLLGQYLVATIVVLMLSGGLSLEQFATRRASSVLDALARRMPQVAHRLHDSRVDEVRLADIAVGDVLIVLPHEICPIDGVVTDGRGRMDEAYLTGEPYEISKAPGSHVISGAINGDSALTVRAEKLAVDSRYERIMRVMQATEQNRPRLRRLGDELGSWYTPVALAIAAGAWMVSGQALRFLAVLVVATPCPLLIAIPVAVIGAISLSARHSIIVRNPSALEQIDSCSTFIFDKTGTLTYGRPHLTEILCAAGESRERVLRLAGSIEQYSKHPLAGAVLEAAEKENVGFEPVAEISERPGEGLAGTVGGRHVLIIGRGSPAAQGLPLPPPASGLECVMLLDGEYVATMRFRDAPRTESDSFIRHLQPRHRIRRVMLVSGDRESEVRYLADTLGIREVRAGKSPEEKLEIVREETVRGKTLFVGDGINDAPALVAATVGVAFGAGSDITSAAADAVILETSLRRVDELIHIGRRMRSIALQSAVGGMALSALAMIAAAAGYLPPIGGAIFQELIDVFAVLNAVRVAFPRRDLHDF
ncbi:MAG TPA: heavy metal translocating P-type ATPase [Patescibacteria group bacterium]|nr:heavy metal translocating P-type ATPase [Patescibacteria group bacterium]